MRTKFRIAFSLLAVLCFAALFAACPGAPEEGGTDDGVSKIELLALVFQAEQLIDSVEVHADGVGLPAGATFVSQNAKDTFQQAITAADNVAKLTSPTQTEINNAVSALNTAMETFRGAIQQNELTDIWKVIPSSQFESSVLEATVAPDPAGSSSNVYKLNYVSGGFGGFICDLKAIIKDFPESYVEADGVITVSYDLFIESKAIPKDGYIDIVSQPNEPSRYTANTSPVGVDGPFRYGRLGFFRGDNIYNVMAGGTRGDKLTSLPENGKDYLIPVPKPDLKATWHTVTSIIDLKNKNVFSVKYGADEAVSVFGMGTDFSDDEEGHAQLYLTFALNDNDDADNNAFYFRNITGAYTAIKTFDVTVQGEPVGGKVDITPNPARVGELVTITGTPANASHVLTSMVINGGITIAETGINSRTFIMPGKNVTVSNVEFSGKKLVTAPVYTSTTNYTKLGGTVAVDPALQEAGKSVAINAAPFPGFRVKSISVVGTESETDYSSLVSNSQFVMPDDNVTVSAEFEVEPNKAVLYMYDWTYASTPRDLRLMHGETIPINTFNYESSRAFIRVADVDFTKLKSVTALASGNNQANAVFRIYKPADVTDTGGPDIAYNGGRDDSRKYAYFDPSAGGPVLRPKFDPNFTPNITDNVADNVPELITWPAPIGSVAAADRVEETLPFTTVYTYTYKMDLNHDLSGIQPLYFEVANKNDDFKNVNFSGNAGGWNPGVWYLILEYGE